MLQFKGVQGFSFSLDRVRDVIGRSSLRGVELRVYAEVTDWYFGQSKTNVAACHVLSSDVILTFLGGEVQTFKPNTPLRIFVSLKPSNCSLF